MRVWGIGAMAFLLATGLALAQDEVDPEFAEAAPDEQGPYEEATVEELVPEADFGAGPSEEAAPEEPHPLSQLEWIVGPAEVEVGENASLSVPEGYMFLHPDETAKFQELVENPSSGKESLIAPDDMRWFGLLEFQDIGYVKDDEEIDAEALLESVREGTEAGNEERRKRGWAELHVTGWRFVPRYDSVTQRLEWAIAAESQGEEVVNFNTRLLGRKGVTSAILVSGPESLDTAVAEFKSMLEGYEYASGERYADVQEGDHMAEYGLAALIAGGGAAVAAKSGLLKNLWKILAVAGVAVAAWFGKMFKGKKQQDA